MKPEEQSWHDYITECKYDPEVLSTISENINSQIEMHSQRVKELHNKYGKYLLESYKPVYARNFPKLVVKVESPKFLNSDFQPYSFKLQCQITGNMSRYIKVDDYHNYGIFPKDGINPVGYPEPSQIPNKLESLKSYYDNAVKKLMESNRSILAEINDERIIYQAEMRQNWFSRYNEYLNSWDWRNKRLEVIRYDGKKCLHCKAKKSDKTLQVHHLTYNNVGNEKISDLITLCIDCHSYLHSLDIIERRFIEYDIMTERPCGFYFE